jgi:hypothetical protein
VQLEGTLQSLKLKMILETKEGLFLISLDSYCVAVKKVWKSKHNDFS